MSSRSQDKGGVTKSTVLERPCIPGIRLLTRLRVQFSALNEHRFRHAFDCLSPVCNCGLAIEDNEHFLLHCPQYYTLRLDLFGQLSDISGISLASMIDPCAIFFCMEAPVAV